LPAQPSMPNTAQLAPQKGLSLKENFDDQNSAFAIRLPDDFPLQDLFEISSCLNEVDVCVPGYIPPEVGLYHPYGYFYEHEVEYIKTMLIPDRNVVSRFAQLAQGKPVQKDQHLRTAAGLLGFCQCLDIEIEPAIAFHELAHKEGNEVALAELEWFRAADSANTQDLMDVGLIRKDALVGDYSPRKVEAHDLAKPLKRWNRNYILALKMMELELRRTKPIDRVLTLLDWMREDFMFGGPAALLASVYFAPNSPPKKRVFKDKNSADREKAIAGVRNAAWDLTQLSEFLRKVNEASEEGHTRYLFASFDKHLRLMARLALKFGPSRLASAGLSSALSEWWPVDEANRITDCIFDHLDRINSSQWTVKTAPAPDFINQLIRAGEQSIREFC